MKTFMEIYLDDNTVCLKLVFPDAHEAYVYAEHLTAQLRAGDDASIVLANPRELKPH